MQTFLPVADFAESARLLDSPRLGKQRVETLQILRALELPDYGWANHPAVLMWRGRTPALVAYGLAMVRVWRERGFGDTTDQQIAEFAPEVVGGRRPSWPPPGLLPSWVGDEALHRSHRSNLIAKDPEFYRPRFAELFGAEPDDLPYVWPGPDDVPSAPDPRASGSGSCGRGRTASSAPAWPRDRRAGCPVGDRRRRHRALRPRAPGAVEGAVRPAARQGPAPAVRVPRRDRPGDRVGLPIEHGAGLLLGEVVGDYLFQGRELLPHRRPARWDRVVPRTARPPATLQDPRALFQVILDPAVLASRLTPPAATRSGAAPARGRRASRPPGQQHLPELLGAALLDRLGDDVDPALGHGGGSRCCC